MDGVEQLSIGTGTRAIKAILHALLSNRHKTGSRHDTFNGLQSTYSSRYNLCLSLLTVLLLSHGLRRTVSAYRHRCKSLPDQLYIFASIVQITAGGSTNAFALCFIRANHASKSMHQHIVQSEAYHTAHMIKPLPPKGQLVRGGSKLTCQGPC